MKIDIHVKVYHFAPSSSSSGRCARYIRCEENLTFSLDADSSQVGDIKTLYEAKRGTPVDKQVLMLPHENSDEQALEDEGYSEQLLDTMKLTEDNNGDVFLLYIT